ncbi:uncharacterized protein LOC105186486 isoform X1 [Harpegnathos saltator]|uniref:uncharacterized protein LOC105186486 isoform X1 n=1 Tax=Harpegnathos saltator TaxID=610380 RepID=UPI00058CC771|nr:uncharacterized protein LOC105186486 isoform X1 [Harpegnathos saltator]
MKRAEARNHHGGCRTMDAGSDTSYISRYLLYKGCCDYTTEAAPQDASLAETDPGMQVWRMRVCRTRMQHRRIRFGPSRIRLEDLSSRMWPPLSSGCTRSYKVTRPAGERTLHRRIRFGLSGVDSRDASDLDF